MRVYQLIMDVNEYQQFYMADRSRIDGWTGDPMLQFDGSAKRGIWEPFEVFVLRPKLLPPDLWGFELSGTLIVNQKVADELDGFFARAGELLPVSWKGQQLFLLNVTECLNNLDRERSEWLKTPGGELVFPTRFVFRSRRFSESSIFKIPETSKGAILIREETGDPETEFKAAVEHRGIKGVSFKLLWEGE